MLLTTLNYYLAFVKIRAALCWRLLRFTGGWFRLPSSGLRQTDRMVLKEVVLMKSGSKVLVLVSVVIVAFILQVVLIIADHHDSPGLAAVQFSKAYFKLSPSMAK